jgi:nicotinate-nucleotide adenylyltransferase
VLAHEAAFGLGLSRVLLVPTGRAPHKLIADDPGGRARYEMTALAAAGSDLLEADSLEIDAAASDEAPTYTVDTLRALAGNQDAELVLIMGADAAATLESWREPGAILELARLAVAGRPGAALELAEQAVARLGAPERLEVVAMPEIGVSSTSIRRRVAEGGPIRHLVPDAVAELIAARRLYAQGVPA